MIEVTTREMSVPMNRPTRFHPRHRCLYQGDPGGSGFSRRVEPSWTAPEEATRLEEGVDEGADGGRMAEDHEDADHQDHEDERGHPPHLAPPEEGQELAGNTQAGKEIAEEPLDGLQGVDLRRRAGSYGANSIRGAARGGQCAAVPRGGC